MIDVVDLSIEIIRLDIFIGFGVYSLLYVLITLFKKDIPILETIDHNASRFIVFSGIVFSALNILWIILAIATLPDYTINQREYWWAPWIQIALWVFITQLFRIPKIRKAKMLRIVFALLLIVSYEMFVIIVTSIHRDYVPVSWFMGSRSAFDWIAPYGIVVGLLTKVVFFCLLSTLYTFIADRVKLRI
ncbi:MAG: hypothetical protein ACK5RG_08650 [Cyclobacteriaceae bacterium]|jgi:hypothetical protein